MIHRFTCIGLTGIQTPSLPAILTARWARAFLRQGITHNLILKKTAIPAFLISIFAFSIQGCEKKAANEEAKEEVVVKREGAPDVVRVFDDDRMDAAISEAKSSLTE